MKRQTPYMVISALFLSLLLSISNIAVPLGKSASPRNPHRWAFMVYLDGDNNLESAGIGDFLEMSAVGSTSDVHIVVQMDRIHDDYEVSYGDWTSCKRFYVTSGMTPTAANAVADLGEVNMGDPNTLVSFVVWAIQHYQADHYILVLWDHGSGWKPSTALSEPEKGVCLDYTSGGDALSTLELESALDTVAASTGVRVDILGFDACLMSMVEVVCQINGCADIVVASEESIPNDGWPYDDILADLVFSPTMTPATLSSRIINLYVASYQGGSQGDDDSITLSAFNVSLVASNVAHAVSFLADNLSWCLPTYNEQVLYSMASTEKYAYLEYCDLQDFAYEVRRLIPEPTVQLAAQDVMDAIVAARIAEAHGPGHPGSYGLTIYLPTGEHEYGDYRTYYEGLWFAMNTRWDEFLSSLYAYSFDEYFYWLGGVDYTPFDNDGDGYVDAIRVSMDVDTDDSTLDVTVYGYLISPSGNYVNYAMATWTITGDEYEYGYLTFHVPNYSEEGWYDVELRLYDDHGIYEDYRYDYWVAYLYPSGAATISVYCLPQHVPVGCLVTVQLNITDVQDLCGLDVGIGWNSALLEYESRTVNIPAEGNNGGVLYGPPPPFIFEDLNQATGTYRIMAASLSPAPAFDGSGMIVELTFRATAIGTCFLSIFHSNISDSMAYLMPHSRTNGMVEITGIHDIAVIYLDVYCGIFDHNRGCSITVTVENQGNFADTFSVIILANGTLAGTAQATRGMNNTATFVVFWNTTDWPKGRYNVSAYALPVQDEIDLADNTLVYGWVFVTIAGDLNADRMVDIFDIVKIAVKYGVRKPDPRYSTVCDIDGDGDIDIFDLVIVAVNYGNEW